MQQFLKSLNEYPEVSVVLGIFILIALYLIPIGVATIIAAMRGEIEEPEEMDI